MTHHCIIGPASISKLGLSRAFDRTPKPVPPLYTSPANTERAGLGVFTAMNELVNYQRDPMEAESRLSEMGELITK